MTRIRIKQVTVSPSVLSLRSADVPRFNRAQDVLHQVNAFRHGNGEHAALTCVDRAPPLAIPFLVVRRFRILLGKLIDALSDSRFPERRVGDRLAKAGLASRVPHLHASDTDVDNGTPRK